MTIVAPSGVPVEIDPMHQGAFRPVAPNAAIDVHTVRRCDHAALRVARRVYRLVMAPRELWTLTVDTDGMVRGRSRAR